MTSELIQSENMFSEQSYSLSQRNFRKAEKPTLPKNIRESFREIMDVEICMSPMDARVKLDILCTFNLRPVFKGSV